MSTKTLEIMIGEEVVKYDISVKPVGKEAYSVRVNEKEILVNGGLMGHKLAHALADSIKDELVWPSDYKPEGYQHEYINLESVVDLSGMPIYELGKYAQILDYIERWS